MTIYLTQTLLENLPSQFEVEFWAKFKGQEWRLIGLALENINRRIRLNHSEDVLTENQFVTTVNDISDDDTFSPTDLNRYLRYGLIVPRYQIKPRKFSLRMGRDLIYSPDGRLQRIEIGLLHPLRPHLRQKNKNLTYRHPEAAEDFPPFQGKIIENPPPFSPEFREAKRSGCLFVFSQVGHARALHWSTRWKVDLLSMTPERYAEMRREWFAGLRVRSGSS